MKVNEVISMRLSKKGSVLCSIYRGPDNLVENCIIKNPLNLTFKVGNVIKGSFIYNNDGLDVCVLTEVIE